MDNNIRIAVDTLDYAIKQLTEQRNKILASLPLFDKVKVGNWVIHKSTNTYYEVVKFFTFADENKISLNRKNGHVDINYNRKLFSEQFRLAEQWEAEQHLIFLEGKRHAKEQALKPQLPEFYMITVKGERGATVRHESFEIAVKEAKRLSQKTEHRAHILGVVGIVEPTIVQQPILEYQLIK